MTFTVTTETCRRREKTGDISLAELPTPGKLQRAPKFSHSPPWPTHMTANILLPHYSSLLLGRSQHWTGALRSVSMNEGAVACRTPAPADPHLNVTVPLISSATRIFKTLLTPALWQWHAASKSMILFWFHKLYFFFFFFLQVKGRWFKFRLKHVWRCL